MGNSNNNVSVMGKTRVLRTMYESHPPAPFPTESELEEIVELSGRKLWENADPYHMLRVMHSLDTCAVERLLSDWNFFQAILNIGAKIQLDPSYGVIKRTDKNG